MFREIWQIQPEDCLSLLCPWLLCAKCYHHDGGVRVSPPCGSTIGFIVHSFEINAGTKSSSKSCLYTGNQALLYVGIEAREDQSFSNLSRYWKDWDWSVWGWIFGRFVFFYNWNHNGLFPCFQEVPWKVYFIDDFQYFVLSSKWKIFEAIYNQVVMLLFSFS